MLPDEVKTKFVNSVLYWSLQQILHVLHSTVLSCPSILIITNISDLSVLLIVLQLAIRFNMFSTLTKRTSLHFICFPNIVRTQANKIYSSIRPGKTAYIIILNI